MMIYNKVCNKTDKIYNKIYKKDKVNNKRYNKDVIIYIEDIITDIL